MNPSDIFDRSERLTFQTSKEHDTWASKHIITASTRLLSHYEKSTATFKEFETFIFPSTNGCYKKLSYKTEFIWRDEVALFELSCPTKESASGWFTNSSDVRIYTSDPITGNMIYTSLNKALSFPNRLLLFKFLSKCFGWFTDNFFDYNAFAKYNNVIQLKKQIDLTEEQREMLGKYIAIEKLNGLWESSNHST